MRKNRRKTEYIRLLPVILAITALIGCTNAEAGLFHSNSDEAWAEEIYEQALENSKLPEYKNRDFGISSPKSAAEENEKGFIDYSNADLGYITAGYNNSAANTLKLQIKYGDETCTYTLNRGELEAFPLSRGSGSYQLRLFENIEGTKYALILSTEITADIKDSLSPFLKPNQYVNYQNAPVTLALADILARDTADEMEKLEKTLKFTTGILSYDKELAQTATTDYVPELDSVLERRQGICFDYASLMTALLRCMNIPCKLVTGYAGDVFHAWISIWTEEQGWIDNVIYFDGAGWQRADPTFADSGASAREISD